MKSAINECWIKDVRYGRAFFLNRIIVGMKMMIAVSIEWVGPRCSMNGISRSMSGITERDNMRGMLTCVFVKWAVNFAVKYPRAKWPMAYILLPCFRWLACVLHVETH